MSQTRSLVTTGMLARSIGTGVANSALSVERHPRGVRLLGLAFAAAAGAGAALIAAGRLPIPGSSSTHDVSAGSAPTDQTPPASGERALPPVIAAAIGGGVFVGVAGASEVGLRAQGALERWAERTTGHPRLVIGVTAALVSLAVEVAEAVAERRQA